MKNNNKRRHWHKVFVISSAIVFALLLGAVLIVRRTYVHNLKPVSNSQETRHVTIPSGSSVNEIAQLLKDKQLIRSTWAFEWYVRSRELRDSLQAGTYGFNQSQSIEQIVEALRLGDVATDLVTILPGKKLSQTRDDLIKSGFSPKDVDKALEPSQYSGHPALSDKPESASLEGYLYPESFQKIAQTSPKTIILLSLNQMATRLNPTRRASFASRGLSVHQAVIMASMVEQEVSKPVDRAQVAQVFYRRLRENMRLESDPTISYGDPAYNTYVHKGLPPGPISNVTESSLEAVANPSATDWLYFVSGDDGTTYFSRTLKEHEELTRRYCTKLCQ